MSGDETYIDAEQDLLGGIEAGISRGQTLKEAMISLYNSGYEKPEIEKAARAYIDIVNKRKVAGVIPLIKPDEKPKEETSEKKDEKKEDLKQGKEADKKDISTESKKTPQVVSSYGEESKEDKKKDKKDKFKLGKNIPKEKDPSRGEELRSKAATYLLIAILVFLLIALATVFLFRDELVRFINNLFG
jgi:hypothetical protein